MLLIFSGIRDLFADNFSLKSSFYALTLRTTLHINCFYPSVALVSFQSPDTLSPYYKTMTRSDRRASKRNYETYCTTSSTGVGEFKYFLADLFLGATYQNVDPYGAVSFRSIRSKSLSGVQCLICLFEKSSTQL